LNIRFVQDNQSLSTKGVLRGLHFQKTHPVTSDDIFPELSGVNCPV
jgi:dTDP-4-dehydrorhamnose 3,5-epimerase-like enzyme